jgi:hypothetical protein
MGDNLSGRTQTDRCGAAGTVGEGEEGGVRELDETGGGGASPQFKPRNFSASFHIFLINCDE